MRDRRVGNIHAAWPVHEGRRPQRRFTWVGNIEEDAIGIVEAMRIRRSQFHEQIVRVLAVDERRHAVSRFTARQQKRIAAFSHKRIGAQHRAAN